MKLVTKKELLNCSEGTYYTQFKDTKILSIGNIKKVGKYNNILVLQFSQLLKESLFSRLSEFKNSLMDCSEQANYCIWTDKEKRYLERVEFMLPVWIKRRIRILTEKFLAKEANRDPDVIVLDICGRPSIEQQVESAIKNEFFFKFIKPFIAIDYTYIEKIHSSQRRVMLDIKKWPIVTTPTGMHLTKTAMKQIAEFCTSLNRRSLIKFINKVKYRTNIFHRKRNV